MVGLFEWEMGEGNGKIYLKEWTETGPTISEVQVLLHEIIHAVETYFQIEGLSETQVDLISAIITTTLVHTDLLLAQADESISSSLQSEARCSYGPDDCSRSNSL